MQRAGNAALALAPLPPPGAVLGDAADYLDSRQRSRSRVGGGASAVGPPRTSATAAKSAAKSSSSALRPPPPSAAASLAASILRADDDTPLDLLSAALSSSIVGGDNPLLQLARERKRRQLAQADAAEGLREAGITFGPDGRMVIPREKEDVKEAAAGGSAGRDEGEESASGDDAADADVVRGKAAALRKALPRVERSRGGRKDAGRPDDEPAEEARPPRPATAAASGGGWGGRQGHNKGRPGSRPGAADTASRFSAAQFRGKHGSDTRRSGAKFEPFAYVPLDPRSMSGAAGNKSVARFAEVTASTSHAGRQERRQAAARDGLREAPGRAALGKRRR